MLAPAGVGLAAALQLHPRTRSAASRGPLFIAHLPAAYLATRALPAGSDRRLFWLGLAAGVAPDLDLLYFYLVSDRREVHHAYLPHLPLAWIAALAGAGCALAAARAGRTAWTALALVAVNAMVHLALDTVAGGIRWWWPASDHEFVLATVTARHHPWWMNFVLHWTFIVELALVAAAAALWFRSPTRARP